MPENQPDDRTCPEEKTTDVPQSEQKSGIDETSPSGLPPLPNNRRNTNWRMKGRGHR